MLGFAAVFALLPKLQDKYDLPTKGLGLITATSVLCSVLAQLAFARFADRGHALIVMRIGIACMCIGFLWFGVATELWQFALARAVVGFGGGMFVPAARRTVVASDPDRAGERLGMMVAVEVGGFVLGPPLAIAIYVAGGLRLPFVAPVVLLAFGGMTLRVAAIHAIPSAAAQPGAVRSLLANPGVRAALLIGAAANLSIGAFEPVIAKQLHDIGAGDTATGLTLASFALPYVFFAWYGGRVADRFGADRTAVLSMLCTVPCIAMFGIVKTAFGIAVFGIIRSVFDTVTTPSGASAMAHAAPSALLGTGQGLYGATASLMTGVAALAGAPIYDAYGAKALWFASAGSMLVLTLLTAALAMSAGVWNPPPRGAMAEALVSADPSPV
jgi:MFS family permease